MSVYQIQATFGRGEASPKLHSRADLQYFKQWLKICQNWLVMRQGGITRRPGTLFAGEIKDSSKNARLIPFIFDEDQAYVLEVGDFYFRVYTRGGRVGTVEVATPWAMADLFALHYDQTNDVLDIAHRSYQPQRISRLSNTSWSVDAVPFKNGPFLDVNVSATSIAPSGTGNVVPVMTSNTAPSGTVTASSAQSAGTDGWHAFDGDPTTYWSAADAFGQIGYEFTAPITIVGYSISSTAVTGATNDNGDEDAPKSWSFEGYNTVTSNWDILDTQYAQNAWSAPETRYFDCSNIAAYSSYRLNITSNNGGQHLMVAAFTMVQDPNTAPAISLTASSRSGINKGAGFMASDVGRVLTLLGTESAYHPFRITSVTSTTVVQAVLTGAPFLKAQSTTQWKLGAWSVTTGWPARVATFEQRKAYARTDEQPNAVWLTKTGGYGSTLDFSTSVPTADDDAISFVLADVNAIQWIAESDNLLIGTAGAARTLGRDSPNLPFSATNFRQAPASKYGSAPIEPVQVGRSAVFVSRFGKALREFARSDNGIDYETPDISVLSEHLLASVMVELAYAQEPDSVVWGPVGNGELVGMTYEKEQEEDGLHHHVLGGNGFVESACSIPGTDRTEVWLIVRRAINGQTKRYIEVMQKSFDGATDAPSDAWYVDCGLQYSGTPVTTVSGLDHLEGQTVAILADGAMEAPQIVTDGAVSLASGRAASVITAGLPYTSRARTLPSNVSVGDGSGLGRKKKVVKAMIDVLDTGSLKFGRDATKPEELVLRSASDAMTTSVPLKTGFFDARNDGSWADGAEVEMIADGPLPATVRSLTLVIEPSP